MSSILRGCHLAIGRFAGPLQIGKSGGSNGTLFRSMFRA
jgi:hypothetical protein